MEIQRQWIIIVQKENSGTSKLLLLYKLLFHFRWKKIFNNPTISETELNFSNKEYPQYFEIKTMK